MGDASGVGPSGIWLRSPLSPKHCHVRRPESREPQPDMVAPGQRRLSQSTGAGTRIHRTADPPHLSGPGDLPLAIRRLVGVRVGCVHWWDVAGMDGSRAHSWRDAYDGRVEAWSEAAASHPIQADMHSPGAHRFQAICCSILEGTDLRLGAVGPATFRGRARPLTQDSGARRLQPRERPRRATIR